VKGHTAVSPSIGDVVVPFVEGDQLARAQVAGQGGGLTGDALLDGQAVHPLIT